MSLGWHLPHHRCSGRKGVFDHRVPHGTGFHVSLSFIFYNDRFSCSFAAAFFLLRKEKELSKAVSMAAPAQLMRVSATKKLRCGGRQRWLDPLRWKGRLLPGVAEHRLLRVTREDDSTAKSALLAAQLSSQLAITIMLK